jgi:hypothetical protein
VRNVKIGIMGHSNLDLETVTKITFPCRKMHTVNIV